VKCVSIVELSLVALFVCAEPSTPASSVETVVSTTRVAVEAATAALHQALRTNDADALFSHVADDVVMMPPGEAAIRGKAAMRAWYAGFLSQFRTSSLTLTDREVFIGEGWAVELGTYEWGLKALAGGDPVIDRGNYMQVWKQQPDGQWRFAREIWNSSVPPPAPEK
jgi:ketosteroid isomerase-like protein